MLCFGGVFAYWCPVPPAPFVVKYIFPPLNDFHVFGHICCVCFWVVCSVLLTDGSVPPPAPHCFDCCSCLISSEIGWTLFFPKVVLAFKFYNNLVYIYKKNLAGILEGIGLNLCISLGGTDIFVASVSLCVCFHLFLSFISILKYPAYKFLHVLLVTPKWVVFCNNYKWYCVF